MRRYSVLIEHDPDDDVYVASVPALPGCFTQGPTVADARQRIREAIQVHLEGLATLGEPIPDETVAPQLITVEIAEIAARV
jgi:predicted RNase H-like HicB family nuclease